MKSFYGKDRKGNALTLKGKNQRVKLLQLLSKTWVVQRLKHISLSAVPGWISPIVSKASRYQHSIGVGQLSLLITDGNKHDQFLLTATAVLHDVGNGPFSHISDQLMKEVLGFDHERAVKFTFENSPTKDSLILDEYGLDLTEISSILEDKHHLSPFLLGFPDLDNADNIYRFIMTIPGKPLGEASYHPSEIGTSMSLETQEQTLPKDIQKRWFRDREKVYSYVWDDELNMIGWTMLGRALRIMKEVLTPRFFTMTNREAFNLIRLRIPKLAHGLKKKEFKIVFDRKFSRLRGEALKLSDPTNLGKIEDELCKETGLKDWTVGLTVDQPLIKEKTDHWRVYLATYKGNEKLKPLIESLLSNSTPLESTA